MQSNEREARIACQSDIGKHRKNNEDAAFCASSQYGTLLLVCDGIGGHRKGEVASALIIDSLAIPFQSLHRHLSLRGMRHFSRKNLKKANRTIYKMSLSGEEFREMGSTAVGAFVGEKKTFFFSVGDSRAYAYSKEKGLTRVTKDQTYVQFLFDSGRITKDQMANHPQKNLLLNAVGINPDLSDVEEIPVDTDSFDAVLLCSDGLYNMVPDATIADVLSEEGRTTKEKAKKLIDLALEAGGNDNIAVSLMERSV